MKTPDLIGTGERIAQARRAAGLSRRALAEPLALRLWDVEQLEAGRSAATDEILHTIAELLSCSPLWLRSGAELVQFDDKRADELDKLEQELAAREQQLMAREEELARREAALASPQPEATPAAQLHAVPQSRWNVALLAALVAQHGHAYPDRVDEWRATLQAMRAIVGADEALPPQLAALACDVFAPLLRGAA